MAHGRGNASGVNSTSDRERRYLKRDFDNVFLSLPLFKSWGRGEDEIIAVSWREVKTRETARKSFSCFIPLCEDEKIKWIPNI